MFKQTVLPALCLGAALLLVGCSASTTPAPAPAVPGTGQATPVPTLPPPTTGPTLHVTDESLLHVTLQGDVLVIVGAEPSGTTFVRLTGCPGPCRLTGADGVLLPVAGLRVNVLNGLTVQARSPLGDWTDAASYH